MKTVNLEQAFVSNFKKGAMTAFLHANSLTSSMAGKLKSFVCCYIIWPHNIPIDIFFLYSHSVQFVGKKTWIFFTPDVYRNSDMLNAYQTDAVPLVTQSPKGNYEVFVYTSQPGDVLFFTENWVS